MNIYVYHLVIFLAAIFSLLVVIVTGHGNDPILAQILAGVVGGSGVVGSGKLLQSFFNPSAVTGTPPPNKSGGFIRFGLLFLLAGLSLFFLVGCAPVGSKQTTQTQNIELTCAGASASIRALTVAERAGLVSAAGESAVKVAISATQPLCSGPVPPASVTAAELAALSGAVADLAALQSQYILTK